MYLPIYYIIYKRLALKRITGVTDYDLSVFGILRQYDSPCYYKRLHSLLVQNGYYMAEETLITVLKKGVSSGYITRSQVAGNVLYAITSEGKQLLYRFALELDRIVAERCREYGNGMNLE